MKVFAITMEIEVPDDCFKTDNDDLDRENAVGKAVRTLIEGLSDWGISHCHIVEHEVVG